MAADKISGEVRATRETVLKFALDTYGTKPEYPWANSPDNAVLRHSSNKKWYALIMNIPRDRLGLKDGGKSDVMNIKADPAMLGSLLGQRGFYPAYHMNKNNWVSVLLDGSLKLMEIAPFLDMSFELTE